MSPLLRGSDGLFPKFSRSSLEEFIQSCTSVPPRSEQEKFHTAKVAEDNNSLHEALSIYDELLQTYPGNAAVQRNRGLLLKKMNG